MKDVSHSAPRIQDLSFLRSRFDGVLRFAFRLPVYLYRLGLGRLLGYRFLLLVHRGRKSGLLRETVLEAIRYDPATRESVVLSGWGEKADWYRNIAGEPALEVQTGGRRYVPEQRFLAVEENFALISEYASQHPLVFRFLIKTFGFDYPLNGTEEDRRRFTESLRLVAFRPKDEANGRSPLGGQTNVTRQEVMR